MSNDDWFERALRERGDEGPEESTDSADSRDDGEDPDDPDDWWDDGEGNGSESEPEPEPDDWREAGAAAGESESEGGTGDWRDDIDGTPSFDEEFGGGGDGDGDGEFGGDGFFDDDFATAFGSGPGGEFDEAEFDSDIPRIDLGIEGLDQMILGGVPRRHLITCIGGAGSGKTTFGLQFLQHGLENGQNGVFITLEQSYEDIMDTAAEHGWEFDRYDREDRLAVVDLDPIEMANSLDNIRGELPELIMDFDADRLVLDSVSLLEMMYDDEARRRTEVFDFTRSLKKAGVTTFLTSEISQETDYASRYGIIEYLVDAVFFLQYIRGEMQETRLAVEIQKIRNANHSRERKPYEITDGGISVYQQASIF